MCTIVRLLSLVEIVYSKVKKGLGPQQDLMLIIHFLKVQPFPEEEVPHRLHMGIVRIRV